MKKKLAFVDLSNYHDWPMGGILEYELAILPYLAEHYDVELWGVSVNNINPKPLNINGNKYPINIYGNCTTKRRLIPNFWKGLSIFHKKGKFKNKYDIVYVHTGSCMCAIGHMVDKSQTKLVYQQHGLNYRNNFQLNTLIQRPSYHYAQKYSNLVLVVSDEKSTQEYAIKQSKFTNAIYKAIGSPINLKEFDSDSCRRRIEESRNKDAENFIYTGRLTKYKNTSMIVKAFAKYVKTGHPNAIFEILGDGEEYETINQLKQDLGIQKNIRLLGRVPHNLIYQHLQNADIFITGSNGEGCSVSVLEAYASGLPVICGKVPGLEGQIKNRRTGIFATSMTVQSFYEAILEANQNKYQLALNCLEEAQNYDAPIIANAIIAQIDALL